AMIGKWGLGAHTGRPDLQGFDVWYGFLDQRRAHFHYPEWLWRNGDKEFFPDNPKKHAHHTQDLFTAEALRFIRSRRDKPFFLYLPYTLVHAELIVPETYEKPFRDRLDDKPTETQPYEILHRGYNRPRYRHAAFAGAMTFLDRDVGRILDLLKELELDEKTIVFFSSDNGPHSEGGADPRYFNSNGGLRRGKGWLYEGGIRVPMIARWPGRIEAGAVTDFPSWFPDMLPSVAELGGVEKPKVDGHSLVPVLLGQEVEEQRAYMYWSYNRHRAVRVGPWKLYRFYDKFNDITKYSESLFDLSTDPGEARDLSEQYPERTEALAARLRSLERWK
ncbi:MAG: sulfatase-like hydrolase/transferase, partial [Verrucomicrobiota bacterium]